MSLSDFTTQIPSYRSIITKAASYTVLATDEYVQINGAYTMTLPALNALQGTLSAKKAFYFKNVHATADGTIQPGTNAVTGVADTIGGRASFTLKPNEVICIDGSNAGTDWKILSPTPMPALIRVPFSVAVNTNGTDVAVNVFDANGAPANLDVTAVVVIAKDTVAGYAKVKNGTSVINDSTSGTAKSATAGIVTGAVAITTPAVAKGAVMTVESTSIADMTVIITGTMQQYV